MDHGPLPRRKIATDAIDVQPVARLDDEPFASAQRPARDEMEFRSVGRRELLHRCKARRRHARAWALMDQRARGVFYGRERPARQAAGFLGKAPGDRSVVVAADGPWLHLVGERDL